MNELTDVQVAWLAGLYEGEGSCNITTGRAIRVEISMTDQDIISRVVDLTGLGKVTVAPIRGEYKQVYRWGIGAANAVEFLEAILPWLGERRAARARDAVEHWKTSRTQASRYDTECIYGHSYEAPNKRNRDGSCRMCANAASQRYKARKSAEARR